VSAAVTRLLRAVEAELDEAGLRGWILVRDLHTGDEIGIDPDARIPLASLVKVPLAMAVLEHVHDGVIDGSEPLVLLPGSNTALGPAGVAKFRHPVTVAVEDAVYLSVALSDNIAADALFDLVPPDLITARLRGIGVTDLIVRHRLAEDTAAPDEALVRTPGLVQTLATRGGTPGGGHRVAQLDPARASSGSARSLVDLLAVLWAEQGPVPKSVATHIRSLMRDNVMRQRLWPDFSSDTSKWSSKTGTMLNLRHEFGVVEHRDGDAYAVAVLTESRVPAGVQPHAEAVMASAARRLHDHLRR
jgi:beta-lactamase class A